MTAPAGRPFGRAVIDVGLSQGVAGVLRTALPIVVARLLGPEAFGLFSLLIVLVLLVFSLGNLGLPSASTYHIARGSRPVGVAASNSLLFALSLGVGAMVLGLVAGVGYGVELVPGATPLALTLAMIALPGYFVAHAGLGVLMGVEDFGRYSRLSVGLHAALFIGTVVAVLVAPTGIAAVLGWTAGSAMAGIGALFLTRPLWREAGALDPGYWRATAAYGLRTHASGMVTFLNYRLDILLVGILLDARAAGLYAAAVALGETIWFFSQVSSGVLFARLSRSEAERDELTPLTARLVLLATVSAGAVLALGAGPLLDLVYGAPYSEAANALRIVLIGIVALSVSRVLAHFVAARGRPELNIPGSAVGLVANVVLNLLLIPWIGIAGAAAASAFSYSLTLADRLRLYTRLQPGARPIVDCLLPRPSDLGHVLHSVRGWLGRSGGR